ncbi:MAG: hypothetical protein V3T86_03725, partial [Planctomycetota bacterium]
MRNKNYIHLGLLVLLTSAGCVSYEAEDVSLPELAEDVAAREIGPVDFAGALEHAHEHNPELKRLRAEARAAGFEVPPTDVILFGNTNKEDLKLAADPLALSGLGLRGAQARAAEARRLALLAETKLKEQQIAAAIGEAFLIERTLLRFQPPRVDVDPDRFRSAGLASDVAWAHVTHARAAATTEARAIVTARADNRARLRRLLGVGRHAELQLVLPEGEFPVIPAQTDERFLSRPDLAAALARYRSTDAAFRAAVIAQYPTIVIGGEWEFPDSALGGVASLRLPVGAGGPARAAKARREASRHALEQAYLAAQEDARRAEEDFAEAWQREFATGLGANAARAGLHAALVELEVAPDAFGPVADAAPRAIRNIREAR